MSAPRERRWPGIAAWAMQFTPEVSLAPPDDVLLEVQGSLGLFGGTRRRWRGGSGRGWASWVSTLS